jgi:hypothetical protein
VYLEGWRERTILGEFDIPHLSVLGATFLLSYVKGRNLADMVFCRVSAMEYERLGDRILAYKCMWAF